jgi:hypothetical protein
MAPRAASDYDYAEQDLSIAYQKDLVHPRNKPYTYGHRLSQIVKARLHLESTYYQTDSESINKFCNFLMSDHTDEFVAILALTKPNRESSLILQNFLANYDRPDPILIYYYDVETEFNPTWTVPGLVIPKAETVFKTLLNTLTMADAHMYWTKWLLKRLTPTE